MSRLCSQVHWCPPEVVLCIKFDLPEGLVDEEPYGIEMTSLRSDVERSVVVGVWSGTELSSNCVLHYCLQVKQSS